MKYPKNILLMLKRSEANNFLFWSGSPIHQKILQQDFDKFSLLLFSFHFNFWQIYRQVTAKKVVYKSLKNKPITP